MLVGAIARVGLRKAERVRARARRLLDHPPLLQHLPPGDVGTLSSPPNPPTAFRDCQSSFRVLAWSHEDRALLRLPVPSWPCGQFRRPNLVTIDRICKPQHPFVARPIWSTHSPLRKKTCICPPLSLPLSPSPTRCRVRRPTAGRWTSGCTGPDRRSGSPGDGGVAADWRAAARSAPPPANRRAVAKAIDAPAAPSAWSRRCGRGCGRWWRRRLAAP